MSDTILAQYGAEQESIPSTSGAIITRYTSYVAPVAAITDVVVQRLLENHDEEKTWERLGALVNKPSTVLTVGTNMLGSKVVIAREGRCFVSGENFGFLPKGNRRNGVRLNPGSVLDATAGYGKAEQFVDKVKSVQQGLPELEALTQDMLDALPSNSSKCSLAVFGTWNGPEEKVPGAVWFIHSYLKNDDIVEGYLSLPPTPYGFSEHGSIYGYQLRNMNVGAVINFEPLSLSKVFSIGDNYEQVLKALQ